MTFEYRDFRLKLEIAVRDGLKCHYCGHEFSKSLEGWNFMTIDHKTSQKELNYDTSSHQKENLCLCCRMCNSVKGEKSLNDNGDRLKEFQSEMQHRKLVELKWAEMQLNFAQRLHEQGEKSWPTIKDSLIRELQQCLGQQGIVKEYGRDKKWIEVRYEGDTWYFNHLDYTLQAFFLGQRKGQYEALMENLIKNHQYHYCWEYICKYIEPFDKTSCDKGAGAIIKEIKGLTVLLNKPSP